VPRTGTNESGGRMLSDWGPSSPFSTGSWHEPVLKVVLHKPFVHPSSLCSFPFPSPLCSSPLPLELITHFAQILSRFEGPHPLKSSQRLATLSFHLSLLD